MRWTRKSKRMEDVTTQLFAATARNEDSINRGFGENGAGAAAMGHALGRYIADRQASYDAHRLDCKHCKNKPLDFRAILLANFNEALKEEQALQEERKRTGLQAADSFLERVLTNHNSFIGKEGYPDPKMPKA